MNRFQFISTLIILLITCSIGRINAAMPRHGDVVTVHLTTALLPATDVAEGEGVFWDFSNAEIIEPNIQWRYSVYGDTLVSERRPHIRRDYRIAGDTIGLICTEIWCRKIDITDGGAPCTSTATASAFVAEKGRQYQSDSIWGEGRAEVAPTINGTLLLPDDIRIENASMHRRSMTTYRTMGTASSPRDPEKEYNGWYHTEDVISWYSPEYRYLIAETRIISDSVPGYDPVSYIESYIAPPSLQPLEQPSIELLASGRPGSPQHNLAVADENPSDWEGGRGLLNPVVTIEEGQINISGQSPADGVLSFLLCDIAGRIYARTPQQRVTAGETVAATIKRPSNLAPGDYLVRTESPGGISVEKIILR